MKKRTIEDIYALAETNVKLEIIKKIVDSEVTSLKYDTDKVEVIKIVLGESED